ncbi:MAG: Ig-like domain-containing protein, partial [Actinomycetota bacterium]|nr:Ig-like domain-containing protein [Actinomycetota bacterium]
MRVWKDLARGFGAALVVLLVLALGPVSAAMAAPFLTISTPKNGASINTRLPTFNGTSTDSTGLDTITLNVYQGTSPGGTPFATGSTPGEGSWSATPGRSLPDGTYTAVAEQAQLVPPETGVSAPVIFTVDTVKPGVTLNAVPTPTNNPTPTLAGTAGTEEGDSSTVQVTVHEGSLGGPVFAFAAVSKTGGTWSYTTPNLPDGTYTAQATQADEAGNTGTSEAVKFTVHTTPPPVTLNPVTSTHDPTPTLEGSAGTGEFDFPTVHVVVHEGSLSGKEVASGNQSVSAGSWSYTTPHLEDGTYTAQATQSDKAGNTGSAQVTFSVHTASPTVTLNSIKSPTNNKNPSFTGTASDTTAVTVEIHEGPATGPVVSKATATNAPGNWSSGPAATALEGGQYTAVAIQPSSVGTESGKSQPVAFTVETSSPKVTLNSIKSPSKDTTPSFTGTATDTTPVIVEIHEGTAGGPIVSTATAENAPGSWSSGNAGPALGNGQYTAVATQSSSLGNPPGSSNPVAFSVDTVPPGVTLNAVPTPTNNPTPTLG